MYGRGTQSKVWEKVTVNGNLIKVLKVLNGSDEDTNAVMLYIYFIFILLISYADSKS
jgi:hypothetical protein